MTCGVTMFVNGGRGFQMFFEPFSKCSWWFTNMLPITVHAATPESLYHPTVLVMVFLLWSHQKAFDGLTFFKVHLYPMFSTCFLKTFTESLHVWVNYMGLLIVTRCTFALLVVTVLIGVVPRTVIFGCSWISFCWLCLWVTWIFVTLLPDVLILAVAAVGWNTQLWPYVRGCWFYCILMTWYGGFPIKDEGQCGWEFCILRFPRYCPVLASSMY